MLIESKPDNRRKENQPRGRKEKPTKEAMARYNHKIAVKNLTLQLNNNFGLGDFHIVLTYGAMPTVKDAKRHLRNFLRRAGRLCKKKQVELKYISVTEGKNKEFERTHHHLVISGLTTEEVRKLWEPHGHTMVSFLYPNGDYSVLAAYLLKETQANLKAGLITKRWSGSKNLKQPTVKEKTVKRWNLNKTPKEYKHYKLLDWENVVNPITGTLSQWAYYLRI